MTVQLLRRRDELGGIEPPPPEADGAPTGVAPGAEGDARALARLDRWIEGGGGAPPEPVRKDERSLLGAPSDRLGKGALRMVAAEVRKDTAEVLARRSGEIAGKAAAKVARFFAEKGERQALLTLARVPHRTLAGLGRSLPANVEAHILEHTRAIAGKATHSLFPKGTSIAEIGELVRAAVRSGARPVLSVSDSGALAFVIEKEFPRAVGASGEKMLRVVVDLEGRIVTAFPVAAEKKLATLTVRGVAVVASVAPLVLLNAITQAEGEAAAADASARGAAAQRSSWLEKVLELVGPYGTLESSPIALEPNFAAIRTRTTAALEEARSTLGRALTTDEQQAIQSSIYGVWAEAAAQAAA